MHLHTSSIVLITGGASGLGAATAAFFAEKGVQVIVIDRDEVKGIAIAKRLCIHFYPCDVTADADAEMVFSRFTQEVGVPSVLVNCAGVATPSKILAKQGVMPLDFFQHLINVNLVGSFNMLRLAAERMTALDTDENGQRGVIISTASIAAYEGQIGQSAYAASKAGIIGMILPAARELAAHGIRVNAIAPGVFMTPLVEALPQEAMEKLSAVVPNPHRLGKPEEFAKLVWHIVENDYINGETIRIDGALRMQPK